LVIQDVGRAVLYMTFDEFKSCDVTS